MKDRQLRNRSGIWVEERVGAGLGLPRLQETMRAPAKRARDSRCPSPPAAGRTVRERHARCRADPCIALESNSGARNPVFQALDGRIAATDRLFLAEAWLAPAWDIPRLRQRASYRSGTGPSKAECLLTALAMEVAP